MSCISDNIMQNLSKNHTINKDVDVKSLYTVEPRFNEVAGDRPNLFVK